MDYSPLDSSDNGIISARILEQVVISSSRGSSWPRDQIQVSYVYCIGRWIFFNHWFFTFWEAPCVCVYWASQVVPVVKNPPANAGDTGDVGSIPGLGRSPGGGHGNPLQYSCLENPMDRRAWWAAVHGVAKELDMTEATKHSQYIYITYSYILRSLAWRLWELPKSTLSASGLQSLLPTSPHCSGMGRGWSLPRMVSPPDGGHSLLTDRPALTLIPLWSLSVYQRQRFLKRQARVYKSEKAMAPTPVLLLGKSHGRRSLVGCSPWGRYESDTTERLHSCFSLSCIGEGNGNPLQCSCLENPRDGGAWWAAIYGIVQSRTRLKWLSSSSSSRVYKLDYTLLYQHPPMTPNFPPMAATLSPSQG